MIDAVDLFPEMLDGLMVRCMQRDVADNYYAHMPQNMPTFLSDHPDSPAARLFIDRMKQEMAQLRYKTYVRKTQENRED